MTRRRAVTTMAIATIASRVLGFARVMVIAAVLGTTALGNTFQSTNSISNILFDLLAAGALSAALVPQLVHALAKGKKELDEMVGSLMTLSIFALGTITIIGLIFSREIAEVMFSRAPLATKEQQIETGAILLRFFLPQIVLYGIGAIALAILTAKKRFVTIALAPIGSSLVIIIGLGIFYLASSSTGIILSTRSVLILGIAGTGACLVFVSIPVIAAIKNGVKMLPNFSFRLGTKVLSSSIWAVAIQASAAIVLGATIYIGNNIDGAVVAYQLAFVFFLAPYGIISQSFSTVLLPDLSHESREGGDKKEFAELVKLMMKYTYRPMIIATGVLFAIGIPLMRLVTEGRARDGVELVEISFLVLIAGLLPYSLFQAASRVFFAKGNIKLPAICVLLSSLAVSLLSVLVSRNMTGNSVVYVMGIAHSATYIVASIVLLAILATQGFKVWPDKLSNVIIFGSIIYALIGLIVSVTVDINGRLNLLIAISAYFLFTLAVLYVLTPKKYITELKSLVRKPKPTAEITG